MESRIEEWNDRKGKISDEGSKWSCRESEGR